MAAGQENEAAQLTLLQDDGYNAVRSMPDKWKGDDTKEKRVST